MSCCIYYINSDKSRLNATPMATSNSDPAKVSVRRDAITVGDGTLEDIFDKMAKMEMEKHEKMMQLENEKLQLALRNISLERAVYSLRWENKEHELRKKPAEGEADIMSDRHSGSEKNIEKPNIVYESVISSFFLLIDQVSEPDVIIESSIPSSVDAIGENSVVARLVYKVSCSESTFPCILLKSKHNCASSIASYSRALAGYDALAFHTENTLRGHTILIAFPNMDIVRALLYDFQVHPFRAHGHQKYEVETTPVEVLTFDPRVESWIRNGARNRIVVRGLPVEDEKIANAIIGCVSHMQF